MGVHGEGYQDAGDACSQEEEATTVYAPQRSPKVDEESGRRLFFTKLGWHRSDTSRTVRIAARYRHKLNMSLSGTERCKLLHNADFAPVCMHAAMVAIGGGGGKREAG